MLICSCGSVISRSRDLIADILKFDHSIGVVNELKIELNTQTC